MEEDPFWWIISRDGSNSLHALPYWQDEDPSNWERRVGGEFNVLI